VSLIEPPSEPLAFASFADLERVALACTKCPLSETRTQVVFGAGDPEADLMFVGEGPGEQEDRDGIPFVGRAGRLLTSLIEGIGLDRDVVTKLRGREVPVREHAVLMPTLHPSAVLRNGGAALAQARGDFVRVKRALARVSAR
jgi:uracil-DNA glycosylase